MEAEIREFVQRDGASLRWEGDSELVAKRAVMLVQRMGGTSVQEIDGLIAELQTLRALLQEEGERVQRKLAEYAHLCQSATQSTKIIADSRVPCALERRLRVFEATAMSSAALCGAAEVEPSLRSLRPNRSA